MKAFKLSSVVRSAETLTRVRIYSANFGIWDSMILIFQPRLALPDVRTAEFASSTTCANARSTSEVLTANTQSIDARLRTRASMEVSAVAGRQLRWVVRSTVQMESRMSFHRQASMSASTKREYSCLSLCQTAFSVNLFQTLFTFWKKNEFRRRRSWSHKTIKFQLDNMDRLKFSF